VYGSKVMNNFKVNTARKKPKRAWHGSKLKINVDSARQELQNEYHIMGV
jgi:hypothetical protein